MTLGARGRNVALVHTARRDGTFLHIMTAVTIDAGGSFSISILQSFSVNALFIRMNEFRSDILCRFFLSVTGHTHLFLLQFLLRGVFGFDR